MRGRLHTKGAVTYGGGNTPAYAGKTAQSSRARSLCGKHPRVCGEDPQTLRTATVSRETPPRMRGRPVYVSIAARYARNTPAYAGKTAFCGNIQTFFKKHPRVCGEDRSILPRCSERIETPPRMRGRPLHLQASCAPAGNTPAYAGKTGEDLPQSTLNEKHPRVCGEDHIQSQSEIPVKETPPRMRGRLLWRFAFARKERNTPAYAGKTLKRLRIQPTKEKHPRVCGEDPPRQVSYLRPPETPPRMRGRLINIV